MQTLYLAFRGSIGKSCGLDMNSDSHFSIRTLWPAIGLVATLAWASNFDEAGPDGPDIPYFDKIAHFFVFGLMGTLWFRWAKGDLLSMSRLVLGMSLTLAYGVADEWIQSMNPQRSSDTLDWIADASGSLTGILVYRGWRSYRRLMESPVCDLFRWKLAEMD